MGPIHFTIKGGKGLTASPWTKRWRPSPIAHEQRKSNRPQSRCPGKERRKFVTTPKRQTKRRLTTTPNSLSFSIGGEGGTQLLRGTPRGQGGKRRPSKNRKEGDSCPGPSMEAPLEEEEVIDAKEKRNLGPVLGSGPFPPQLERQTPYGGQRQKEK